MSQLFKKIAAGMWQDHPLDNHLVALGPEGLTPLLVGEQLGCVTGPILAKTLDSKGFDQWTILCTPRCAARINGTPIAVGVRVLKDRDAIASDGVGTQFFSAEKVAQILPYPDNKADACCVRCKLPLEPGTLTVRCPNPECGFHHHETADRPCWTYSEGCAACGFPTDLEAGLQWSPEVL